MYNQLQLLNKFASNYLATSQVTKTWCFANKEGLQRDENDIPKLRLKVFDHF